jgi:hypothetical protein
LRWMAIWRLLFMCGIFLGYGGGAFYFNSYVHGINDEAVTTFFVLCKRNIYPTTVALFIKEVASSGEKQLLGRNRGESSIRSG